MALVAQPPPPHSAWPSHLPSVSASVTANDELTTLGPLLPTSSSVVAKQEMQLQQQQQQQQQNNSMTPNSQANSAQSTSSSGNTSLDAKSNQQNVECVVCGDKSSGKHYGQFTCEGKDRWFLTGESRGMRHKWWGWDWKIISERLNRKYKLVVIYDQG